MAINLKQSLDWVPLSQLTEEQREYLPIGSCGAYISPLSAQHNTIDINEAPLETSSKQSKVVDQQGYQNVTLIGDVIVTKGYRKLTADQATYSGKEGTITIDGELTIREPDLLLIADHGVINQQTDSLIINDATYVIHSANVRGGGDTLEKAESIIQIDGGEFTQCAPGNNDWILKGSKIVINTESSHGIATNVRLEVKGIPVFYWPYLRFPIGSQRQSGFLYPVIEASGNALNLSVPYYFNLAPNYDATLTPHFLQNHGTLYELNGRHLNRHFNTDITLAHLSNDKGRLSESEESLVNSGASTEAEINPFRGSDRWLVSIDQTGGTGQRWFSTIDYNEVSDNDYLEDFEASSLNRNSDISLKQQIQVGYQFKHWRLTVDNQQFQTLDDSITQPFKQLPQITFDGAYTVNDWNINLNNEWTRFDHSSADDPGSTTLVGDRTLLKYSVELDKEYDAGFFRPRLQTRYLGYQLNENILSNNANNTPSLIAPQAIIDSGLILERNGNGYLQTFEPRLFYFFSPTRNQSDITGTGADINFDTGDLTFSYNQLFNDTRFSGGDRLDDANQLSIGLTTRFISEKSGRELFSASIGKALYFEERQVTLSGETDNANNSPIAARINASFNEEWQLNNDIIYDDDANKIDDATVTLRYRSKDSTLFNMSHRFLRSNNTEQGEVSIIKPLSNNNWYLIGHTRFDYQRSREIERLIGVEHNSCCYRARFAYTRRLDDDQLTSTSSNLEYDQGFIIEFQFLGLGGTGKQFDKLLSDTIDGYEQWQETYR